MRVQAPFMVVSFMALLLVSVLFMAVFLMSMVFMAVAFVVMTFVAVFLVFFMPVVFVAVAFMIMTLVTMSFVRMLFMAMLLVFFMPVVFVAVAFMIMTLVTMSLMRMLFMPVLLVFFMPAMSVAMMVVRTAFQNINALGGDNLPTFITGSLDHSAQPTFKAQPIDHHQIRILEKGGVFWSRLKHMGILPRFHQARDQHPLSTHLAHHISQNGEACDNAHFLMGVSLRWQCH